jgi:hypothetical protein
MDEFLRTSKRPSSPEQREQLWVRFPAVLIPEGPRAAGIAAKWTAQRVAVPF